MNERFTNSDKIERLSVEDLTNEERTRLLGALGLVDATMFDLKNPEHPEDDNWITKGNN